MNNYEIVIGLEVHAELKTDSKIFCSCSTAFGAEPNTQVCPVCLGHPGTLPVLNKKAVELSAMAGIALGCKIAPYSKFDRKNYFYPDLPKAYQISQFDIPLCTGGHLDIEADGKTRSVGITRIHMEEDAGKLIHKDNKTLIDCNRCGIPLIEIVSEPDMRSAAEAIAYLTKLRKVLLFAKISDCKMNEGSLRCDVNLSVRKPGEPLGTRCELKNLNSFKFIEKAIEYEAARQIELIESGGTVLQETRRFDEDTQKTYSMRKKESQSDYRFFEEPDIPPVIISDSELERLRAAIPPLPDERKALYLESFGIPLSDGEVLTQDPETAEYFEKCAAFTRHKKTASNLILTELLGIKGPEESLYRVAPGHIGAVADMMGDETINSATAKKLIHRMWEEDFDPSAAVEKEGLAQINDESVLTEFVRSAIAKSQKAVEDYKKGKATAARSIVGKAMAESRGRANPALITRLVESALNEL